MNGIGAMLVAFLGLSVTGAALSEDHAVQTALLFIFFGTIILGLGIGLLKNTTSASGGQGPKRPRQLELNLPTPDSTSDRSS